MAKTRKILIADPDVDSVRGLTRALRQRGHQVYFAPDGSRALEVAVLRHPDLVLFDDQCKLLEARTFIQILRTNPRTEEVPVVLTAMTYDPDKLRGLRDGYLRKPFNLDEVLARIDHIFRKSEAARSLKGQAHEIEGTLTQLSIPDLLQILSMNKRTGQLALSHGRERGTIHVVEGRPANAQVGAVEGEKALFRLLSWTEGTFSFAPTPPTGTVRIQRSMDDALLEGMRQKDEVARQLAALPPDHTRLELSPTAAVAPDQHPVTAQVMELLKQPRALSDVVDLTPATDLDVLTVVNTLLLRGVARQAAAQQVEGEPLLSAAEVHALRGRLSRGRTLAQVAVAKVFVIAGGTGPLKALSEELPEVKAAQRGAATLESQFGTWGRLDVSETLKLDLCVLPPFEAARPLWRPFCSGAVGALLLEEDEESVRFASFLAREICIPLVVMGPRVPPVLKDAPAGVLTCEGGYVKALRALLMQSLASVGTFQAA